MINRFRIAILATLLLILPVLAFADKDITRGTAVLPEHYYEPCPQQGTVMKFMDDKSEQEVNVYFPHGYFESCAKDEQYDLFFMLHQAGNGNYSSWIETPCQSYGGLLPPMQVYDWLIYEKKIPPILVACINLKLGVDDRENIRNGMAWCGDNLRTFAKDGSMESLHAAREHFFVGGRSMGAGKTDECLRKDYDIFGNFIIGYGGAANYVAREIGDRYNGQYPDEYFIYNLIYCCGEKDVAYDSTQIGLQVLAPVSKRSHYFKYYGGHGWAAAIPTIYDSLLFIYQDYEEPCASLTDLIHTVIQAIQNKLGESPRVSACSISLSY